jgi:prepilin-type N-terminal cleavage/methylation domain-containing protein
MRGVTERGRRRGMTLIEIMVSLVLLGIISGVIMRVIMRQQRFYQGVNQIMGQRGQLRQATSVLPIDLRSLSSIGNDILVASDSSIEFTTTVGTGAVCAVVDGAQVALPPETLASGQTITTWYGYGEPDPKNKPQSAYTVYIYNDSSVAGNEEDRWQKFKLSDVQHSNSVCLKMLALRPPASPRSLEITRADRPVAGGRVPVVRRRVGRDGASCSTDATKCTWILRLQQQPSQVRPLSPMSGPFDAYAGGSGAARTSGSRRRRRPR